MQKPEQRAAEVLRLKNVMNHTGLSRSTIYSLVKQDQFPKQIKLGKRASGWLQTEVSTWIANKAGQR